MIFCAPIVFPDACIAAICFRWLSEKVTPTRVRAVMPFTGSFKAFPSWIAAACGSVPIARAMSTRVFVDWLKMSLPLPASLRIPLKVRRRFAPFWIDSACVDVAPSIEVARL
jgi:hypothetical protein